MTNADEIGERKPALEPSGGSSVAGGDLRDGSPKLQTEGTAQPDFADTERTFKHLSNTELRQASWLFALMGKPWLTRLLSSAGVFCVRWRIPGAAWAVRRTIYRQFVGGTDLTDALPTIERLFRREVTSILDYGVEAKSEDADFDRLVEEVRRAIQFGAQAPAAGSVVVKVTGVAPNEVLEEHNDVAIEFDGALDSRLAQVIDRLETICATAAKQGVQVYLDAEESWFQGTIDRIADGMMRRHNRGRVVVLNTFQLYRHDRVAFLEASFERARAGGLSLIHI